MEPNLSEIEQASLDRHFLSFEFRSSEGKPPGLYITREGVKVIEV